MMPTPISAFAEWDDAMMGIVAMLSMLQADPSSERLKDMLEEQLDRAVQAYADLATRSDAIAEIKAFLLATYGGQPG